MWLYDRSAMAAILDMKISYLFRAIHQGDVLKTIWEGWVNIGGWRTFW